MDFYIKVHVSSCYGIFPYYGYEQQFMKLGNLGILL